MNNHIITRLAIAALFVLPAAAANALSGKSFVAPTGSDANSCGSSDPCFSFQRAHDMTTPGGEINCGDGVQQGFDLTITKTITIDCGKAGSIYRLANAITINGSGVVVKFRNLTFNGTFANAGSSGIDFFNGAELVLENCLVHQMPGIALRFMPARPGSQLRLINTTFDNNGTAPGTGGEILVAPQAGGSAGLTFDHVTLSFNVTAMVLNSANGTIGGFMRDSIVTSSRSSGIAANAGTSINFNIARSALVANVGAAIQAAGSNSVVRISDSEINSNQTGVSAVSGGNVQSFKNNRIFGNGIDGTPIAAVPGYSGNSQ